VPAAPPFAEPPAGEPLAPEPAAGAPPLDEPAVAEPPAPAPPLVAPLLAPPVPEPPFPELPAPPFVDVPAVAFPPVVFALVPAEPPAPGSSTPALVQASSTGTQRAATRGRARRATVRNTLFDPAEETDMVVLEFVVVQTLPHAGRKGSCANDGAQPLRVAFILRGDLHRLRKARSPAPRAR
jgi:hypothetical protein